MNKKEKLIKRFRTLPRDFTFEEVVSLFQGYGFELANTGATSGSRIKFYNVDDQNAYIMHKPHPSNIIKGFRDHKRFQEDITKAVEILEKML